MSHSSCGYKCQLARNLYNSHHQNIQNVKLFIFKASWRCHSGQCLMGTASPTSDNIRLFFFYLPQERRWLQMESITTVESRRVQRTSHVESPELWKSRLFILWDSFCNLAVLTSNYSLPGADLQGCKASKLSETEMQKRSCSIQNQCFNKTVRIRN